jgi:cation diffusion facilitator CzcD-associated flavoprotein CzcO
MSASPRTDASPGSPRFLVIGAGMAGVLAAIRLREAGLDFTVYEKADSIGGTWRENTYPGIACDVPSHFYSYSFALNPEWSQRFAPGAEIRDYFEDVARRYEVVEAIRFGQEVTRLVFEDGRWKLETADGTRDEGDFVIAATGVLHHPNDPEIEGRENFRGRVFHSARWDHDVPIEGKRVGVVGTGSSAMQIVSALAGEVDELVLFQRTAQWVTPMPNEAYSEGDKARFRADTRAMEAVRREASDMFTQGFANVLVDAKNPVIQAIHQNCEQHLETSVSDPELRERLRPDYQAACKRLVMSDGFYEAIQHPTARLVTDERLEEAGVRTTDGALHEIDVLVLATGFRVDSFVRPIRVFGRGGLPLDEVWEHGPYAYLAVSVPEFPNFFMLNGPNGPVGNFSLIEVAELQFRYIEQLVAQVQHGACREICVSQRASDRFDAERREAAKSTIWASGCKSWYLDENGLPTAWPFTFDRFREEMSKPRLEDFDLR